MKRRTGNPGKRPLPEVASVTVLPMAGAVPDPPEDLLLDGRRLWARVWAEAITWISPDSDMEAVEQACRLADDVALARTKYRVTRDNADARMVVQFNDQLVRALAKLGLDPTARSALGIAEVKRASKLEELLTARTEKRRGASSGA